MYKRQILDGAINDTDTVYTLAYGLLGEQDIVVDGFIFRHATGRMSGPVSYTHLDVYKRQIIHSWDHSPLEWSLL